MPHASDKRQVARRPQGVTPPVGRGTPPVQLGPTEVADYVARAQGGDSAAFGVLYSEYRGRIFSLARFSLPHQAAEDAVGETFVRAWQALPRYRDMGVPFVSWLYGIARHVVADALRVRGRVDVRAEPPRASIDSREQDCDRLALGAAIAELPDEQRMVIELKFLGGLTNDEVASILGKSPGAVNTQQWRALRALRDVLEEAS